MANKRMLDRAITRGKRIKLLSDGSALLYTWAIPFTDDFGRIDGDPEVVWADLFSMRKGWNPEKVAKSILEWAEAGLGRWYAVNTHTVFQFDQDNFEEFQKGIIHKRTSSKYPDFSDQAILISSENFSEHFGTSEKFRSILSYPNLTKPNLTAPPKGANTDGFERFWKAYPKKRAKGDAEKAWNALKPSEPLVNQIIATLELAKTSAEWQKDNGQFIPYPATWLRRIGWEDEYGPDQADNPTTKAELEEKLEIAKAMLAGYSDDELLAARYSKRIADLTKQLAEL